MSQQVAFRRVHGHIIPIKIGGKKADVHVTKNTVKGAGEIAAGAGAAAYAGGKAFQFLKKAADVEKRARSFSEQLGKSGAQGSLFKQVRHGGPEKLFRLSGKLHRARNFAIIAGGVVGGALISKGVHDVLKDNKHLKKHPEITKAASITGGFAIAHKVGSFFYRRGVHPTEALKKAAQYASNRKTFQYAFKGI